jgi:integrase
MPTIRKRGPKWQVQIRRKGSKPLVASFHLLQDAKAWAREMERRIDRRDLPPDPRTLEAMTLAELVSRYRDTVIITKKTRVNEATVLNAFLRHPICRLPVSQLSESHFASYRDERLAEIKPSSLKRSLAPLHHLFELAKKEWGLPLRKNPVAGLKIPSCAGRERRLRAGEYETLLAGLARCRNSLIPPLISLALLTGLRRGELLSMRWEHIDWASRTLLIPVSKNGHARIIPLSIEALQLLRTLSRTGDRVFSMSGNAVRLAWDRACRKARLDDLHFHDLRHEAISRFFEKGLTVPEVAMISGHRDMRMLLRYAHAMRQSVLFKLDSNSSSVEPSS